MNGLYRVVAHHGKGFDLGPVAMTSQAFRSHAAACRFLDGLVESGLFTGGHVEVYVDGPGWVLSDEPAES